MPPPTLMLMVYNEEDNLPAAIGSFPKGTPIVLYDSFSTDRTIDVAKQYGNIIAVYQRKFDNFAAHQNWAVENIDFKSPWVYYTDADEHMTPDLWAQICAAADHPGDHVAFESRRKDMFLGTWIKHSSFYPCWFQRLFRPEKIRWERTGHVVAKIDGPVGRLDGHFIHYPFSHGVSHWFKRHVDYAAHEADDMLTELQEPVALRHLFGGGHRARRRTLKHLFYKSPCRPALKFLVLYLLRRGFLDGRAGFHYAMMLSFYEYMISVHKLELRRRRAGLAV